MAHKRKLAVCGVNIRTHPAHSAENYYDLLRYGFRRRKAIRIHGDQAMMLESFRHIKPRDPLAGIYGELAKFVEIDLESEWFNKGELRRAEPEEVEEISLPDFLEPNLTEFRYIFFPKHHLFVFETEYRGRHLSPRLTAKFLDLLLSTQHSREKYGDLDLTILPTTESLEKIYRLPNLRRLELRIERPNADVDGEKQVLKRLQVQGSSRWDQQYKAARNAVLEPDDETKKYARIAAHNGFVEGTGRDENGISRKLNTKKHPLIETDKFDPDIEEESGVFFRLARKVLETFKRR